MWNKEVLICFGTKAFLLLLLLLLFILVLITLVWNKEVLISFGLTFEIGSGQNPF